MVIGTAGEDGNTINAFNASNANPVWSLPLTGAVHDAAFVDYRAHPNVVYVATLMGPAENPSSTGSLIALRADTAAPVAGSQVGSFPPAAGSPILLKPSANGPQGTVYIPTVGGLYIADAAAPLSATARRFPVGGVTATPSATGATSGDVLAATIGVGPTSAASLLGFTGGNVYGLNVQAVQPVGPRP